jgi:transposase
MTQAALQNETISSEQRLHMSFELSHKEWKLAFGTGPRNPRIIVMPARDLMRLDEEIAKAKKRFGLSEDAKVFSCFEAGRDGLWIHRHSPRVSSKEFTVM